MSCGGGTAKEDADPDVYCVAGTKDAMVNLRDKIDFAKITVLNADDSKGGGGTSQLKAILKADPPTASLRSDSDVDHQLLIFVPFQEAVKVHGICFSTAIDSKSTDAATCSGPKTVKVFINSTSLDFESAQSTSALQTFTIGATQLDGRELLTNFVKFQNVLSVALFIESNQKNTPVTLLSRLSFIGCPKVGFNVNNIKKVG